MDTQRLPCKFHWNEYDRIEVKENKGGLTLGKNWMIGGGA